MDIVTAYEYADESIAKLQKKITQELKAAGMNKRILDTLVDWAIPEIAELHEELHDAYDEAIGNNPAEDLEAWKDIVMAALPAGASVAMANDVEAVLDQFKSVY